MNYLASDIIDKKLVVAVEHCEGKCLAHYLGHNIGKLNKANVRFGEDTIVLWLVQALLAAQYMNQNGIIHGDINPNSILITSTGSIKIANFGDAQILYPTEPTKAATMSSYAAPEVLNGTFIYDHRSDVWSLGCIFYELSALKRLDPKKTEPLPETYSAELQETISKMIQKDSVKRCSVNDILRSELVNRFIAGKLTKSYVDMTKANIAAEAVDEVKQDEETNGANNSMKVIIFCFKFCEQH